MATWDDVRRLALALPETTERPAYGTPAWRVRDRLFVWDRPLRGSDLAHLGPSAPIGQVLGVYTGDLAEKAALLASRPDVVLDVPHLHGHPVLLAQLDLLGLTELKELVVDAWLARAPARLAQEWLTDRQDGPCG